MYGVAGCSPNQVVLYRLKLRFRCHLSFWNIDWLWILARNRQSWEAQNSMDF